jgi:hypothetical protein
MTTANGRPDILISSGRYFDYLNPEDNKFDIEDIAWSLSRLCRFAGHIRREFDDHIYSVAQHSVLVSYLVPPEFALAGLLHDSAEAWLLDIVRPLKQLLDSYKAIERSIEPVVLAQFGLPYPMHPAVHRADRVALYIEQRDVMPPHSDDWERSWITEMAVDSLVGSTRITECQSPKVARLDFLRRYRELAGAVRPS